MRQTTDGNHGRGVFIDVKTREEIEQAYAVALEEGSGVLVERSIPGTEHRLLVVHGGTPAAACRGDVVCVVGDGVSTVRERSRAGSPDPRRPDGAAPAIIRPIPLPSRHLSRQRWARRGFSPAQRQEIMIQRNANHAFDVTDPVHPDNAALAALAARIVGLDIAGIDLVAEGYFQTPCRPGAAPSSKSMRTQPAHASQNPPSASRGRWASPSSATCFPKADGAYSIVGITGSKGKTTMSPAFAI